MCELVFMYQANLLPNWINWWFPDNCNRSVYNPDRHYGLDTVFYYDMYGSYHDTIPTKLQQGHRVIYDAKNEHYLHLDKQWVVDAFKLHPGQGMFLISGDAPQNMPGVTIQATPYWYWIMDQINYSHHGYENYQPEPTNEYKFFMQMQMDRSDRDRLFEKLTPFLNDALYSYRNRGFFLPNDYTGDGNWQRYMNFDWINQTCFSLTVETYMDEAVNWGISLTMNDNWFLCEKAYKAIAAHHPFLLASTPTNLVYLRSQGFETFPELWDESYDHEPDFERRTDFLVDIVKNFDKRSWDQRIVKEKLEHNRARFFDRALTKKFCQDTIIDPVLRFAE